VTFGIDVVAPDQHARHAARTISEAAPAHGSLVLTGGTTAMKVYPLLRMEHGVDWARLVVLFSDERCVPPHEEASNYRMAHTLLPEVESAQVRRMRGEDDPDIAASEYHSAIEEDVRSGLDLLLLGMGADCHIGAMFPGSPALDEDHDLCRAVERPDGLKGLTLTPPAMLSAKKILLLVTGEGKAEAVRRAIESDQAPADCPARLLADHPDATFLLDAPAAARLS
jgi:6-phosphogluconolactonase